MAFASSAGACSGAAISEYEQHGHESAHTRAVSARRSVAAMGRGKACASDLAVLEMLEQLLGDTLVLWILETVTARALNGAEPDDRARRRAGRPQFPTGWDVGCFWRSVPVVKHLLQ